MNWNDGLENKI